MVKLDHELMTYMGKLDIGKTPSPPLPLSSWLFISLRKLLLSSRMKCLARRQKNVQVDSFFIINCDSICILNYFATDNYGLNPCLKYVIWVGWWIFAFHDPCLWNNKTKDNCGTVNTSIHMYHWQGNIRTVWLTDFTWHEE